MMSECPTPPNPPALAALTTGYDCRDTGDSAGAERWFQAAVAAEPRCAEAHGALGDLLAAAGRWAEAVPSLRQADALEPNQPYRLAALAEALAAAGDGGAALAVARRRVGLAPGSTPAQLALAVLLLGLNRRAEALAPLREVVLLDPDHAEAAARLGGLLTDQGDPLAALEAMQPALRRHPGCTPLHFQLGRAWLTLGESAKAAAAWRTCLDLAPEDEDGAGAALAGLGSLAAGNQAPDATAPDPIYVRALFDRYAERFDAELLGRLDYRAPHLLFEAIRDLVPGGLDILDLGCGTGLAGVAFAPLARHLAGVDLSPRMVDQARRRGLYHALSAVDLFDVLRAAPAAWDLIIAADVFNYLGDLGPVLAAVAAALRPGGKAAATLEAGAGDDGFQVAETRRVRHGAGHLRAAAKAAGLTLITLNTDTLRTERGQPVAGLVFVVEKPPTVPSAIRALP